MDETSVVERMSVGIVLHDLSLGGTERIALRLARQWARSGAKVTVFCGSSKGELQQLLCPSIELVEAPTPIERGLRSLQRLGQAAADHFHMHPVDVVFIPGNFHWRVVPALARLPRHVRPAIVTQVSAALDKRQRGPLRQAWFDLRMRLRLRGVDGAICMSERAREQANHILRRNVAIRIPLPALDEDTPPPVAVQPDCRIVVAAGRLVREKGFSTLIEAFACVGDPDARLMIIGKGPDEARLRRQIFELGMMGRISLPGFAPCIRPWLDQCRAFVLSSHYEGFPAVVVEALAAGRQVIATRCTHAVKDLAIEGRIGRSVPICDAGAMAEAIREILASAPPDPEVLAAAVAMHRIGGIAEDYLQAFRRCIRQTGAGVSSAPYAAGPRPVPAARTAYALRRSA
ncbi:MAG: glycosyltransferase [Pseudomonadota bacterium]